MANLNSKICLNNKKSKMDRKKILIIFSLIFFLGSLFLITLSFYAKNYKIQFTKSSPEKDICETLKFNENAKINILFFSPNKKTANSYIENLLQFEPFFSNKDVFNFFFIKDDSSCSLYRKIAIVCYSRELLKRALNCNYDFIVKIDDTQEEEIRSSTYANFVSLNSKTIKSVFPHEVGHLFGLADEYVPAQLDRNAPNCKKKCEEFYPFIDDCHKGCSRENYYRSIENGLMRTLYSDTYGDFNINFINEKMKKVGNSKQITGKAISENCNINYYDIELAINPENDKVEFLGKTESVGCAVSNGFGDFQYSILDASGNEIVKGSFNPIILYTDVEKEGILEGDAEKVSAIFILRVPKVKDDSKIVIQTLEDRIYEKTIKEISDIGTVTPIYSYEKIAKTISKEKLNEIEIEKDFNENDLVNVNIGPIQKIISPKTSQIIGQRRINYKAPTTTNAIFEFLGEEKNLNILFIILIISLLILIIVLSHPKKRK